MDQHGRWGGARGVQAGAGLHTGHLVVMVTLDGRDDGNGAGAKGGGSCRGAGGPDVAGEGPVLGQPGGAGRLMPRPGQRCRRRQRGFPGNGNLHT